MVRTVQEFAEAEGLLFMETSALQGSNVTPAFQGLVQEIFVAMRQHIVEAEAEEDEGGAADLRGRTIVVEAAPPEPAKSSSCCGS